MGFDSKYRFFVLMIFIFISTLSFPQNLRKARADKFFESGEYAKAATIYKKSLKSTKVKSEKAEINFKITECFRLINSFKKIDGFYRKAISLRYQDPIIYFNYGTVLLKLEKFDEALIQFKKYKELAPVGEKRADEGIESVSLARDWKKNPAQHIVKVFKKINSRYDDFCPSYDESKDFNDIYFTSNRDKNSSKQKKKSSSITGPQTSNITGQIFCDIFMIKKKKNEEWNDPVALDTIVNTEFDDGAASIPKDGKSMFYSICKIEKNKQIGCQIFESKKTAGNWGAPKHIKLMKDSTTSLGHVSVSANGNTMYFASSMRGGKGGMDIWKVSKEKGDWGTLENMKEINTAANEDFPCIREDSVFFFSSDRSPSMGGLDIFRAEKDEDGKYVIENMKSPMNSAGDDFGITFQGKSDKGLFTSNRVGGQGGDDIYFFEVPPVEYFVKGLVKNEVGNYIPGAIVRLFGSDGSSFKDTTSKDGRFQRKLKKKTDYAFAIYKDGYFMGKGKFSTVGITQSHDFRPIVVLTALAKTFEISNINYDFGKTSLKEESKPTLDSMAEIMKDNPNLTIELSSHSDMVGNDEINLEISQKRAQSVVDYLVEKGINPDRMVAVGYGKSKPKVISKDNAKQYNFFKDGDILDDAFVNNLKDDEKAIANALNRRTEFKVLSASFTPGKKN